MKWTVAFLPEASADLDSLSRTRQAMVKKAIAKAQENPLPQNQGGYGKPLGHKRGMNLTNLLKIKLRNAGIRIVYKLYSRANITASGRHWILAREYGFNAIFPALPVKYGYILVGKNICVANIFDREYNSNGYADAYYCCRRARRRRSV